MASDNDSEFEGFSANDVMESENRLRVFEDNYESDLSISESDDDDENIPLIYLRNQREDSEDSDTEVVGINEWSDDLQPVLVEEFREETGPTSILDGDKCAFDFFQLIFGLDLIDLVTQTNLYAHIRQQQRPDPKWRNVTAEEMKAFLGFHIIMGIIQAPMIDMYWSTDPMFQATGISERITRDRFDKISQYFHVASTSENPPRGQEGHDRLAHVRPVIEKVKTGLSQNYKPNKESTIDEAMIGYNGRLSFKQYVPMKPTKRGIKVWVRADPNNGYINDFLVYCGKEKKEVEKGLGENVVKELCRPILNKGHHIYWDNYFTSVKLFQHLLDNKTYACGTVRVHRQGLPVEMKKAQLKNHGDSITFQKGNLVATSWRDKRVVNFLSTNTDPTQTTSVQRKQKDGTIKDVPAPKVVKMYGQFMNGVDRADQLRAMYALGRKSMKWWKYVFWFLVDISITCSFILMKESPNHQRRSRTGKPKPLTQLEFRQNLAKQLIGEYCQKRKRHALKEVTNNGANCWIEDLGKKKRCKYCTEKGIRKEPKYGCVACQVNLCVECFKPYHLEKYPNRYHR